MTPTFAELGVPTSIDSNLRARGIDAPFPIQAATIPDALAGRDVCGRAPTGSGKTIAFGIPLVHRVGRAEPRRPRGLVLVPTRELASQVCEELQLLARPKGPWVEAFYGGVGFDRQLRALAKGVDIAVACPGRLMDLINSDRLSLADVEIVVIDEADRMADMGFLPEVRRILDQCRPDRQTVLFSATLDGDVDVLIRQYQRDPVRHEHVADEDDGSGAEHRFWGVERTDRLPTTASIVATMGPTVVFCRTKRGADRVARQLDTAGIRAAAIHGDRSQAQRERALDLFHRGRVQALVATDVAARGIHVDGVTCVVHYDPPADAKDYVHRSGRTARAGATGLVISLVPGDLKRAVYDLQKDLGVEKGLAPKDLDELAGLAPERPARTPAPRPSDRARRVERVGDLGSARGRDRDHGRERTPERRRGDRTARPAHDDRRRSTAGAAGAGERALDERGGRDRTAHEGARAPRRPDAARGDRGTTAARDDRGERGAGGPGRTEGVRPERAPLAPGQKRPSGAARRKAKRLNAIEAARLAGDGDAADLYDGRSSREPRVRSARPGRPAGPAKARLGGKGKAKAGAGKAGSGRPGSGKAGSGKAGSGKAGPGRARAGSTDRGAGGARTGSTRGAGASSAGAGRSSGPTRGATAHRGSPARGGRQAAGRRSS